MRTGSIGYEGAANGRIRAVEGVMPDNRNDRRRMVQTAARLKDLRARRQELRTELKELNAELKALREEHRQLREAVQAEAGASQT